MGLRMLCMLRIIPCMLHLVSMLYGTSITISLNIVLLLVFTVCSNVYKNFVWKSTFFYAYRQSSQQFQWLSSMNILPTAESPVVNKHLVQLVYAGCTPCQEVKGKDFGCYCLHVPFLPHSIILLRTSHISTYTQACSKIVLKLSLVRDFGGDMASHTSHHGELRIM